MSVQIIWGKAKRAAIGLGLAVLLSGCLFSPGNFTSALDLRKDGTFTFSYQGEIHMMALSQLSQLGRASEEFTAQACYDDAYDERPCNPSELDQQRAEWTQRQESKQQKNERDSEMAKAMLGGIDPSDPEAAEEFAERLSRQKGWNSVEYRGDGLFVVDFAIASRMGHDFIFPVFEGFPMANTFVLASLRDGNAVRIEAPGFSAQSASGNPMAGMMGAMAMSQGASAASGEDDSERSGEKAPLIPELNGTFTITTDAAILTNNTDEGPQDVAGGQQLRWEISRRTAAAPVALIRLGD